MAISVSDYKAKFAKTQIVKVEEGVEFEIKTVSPVDMWDEDPKKTKSDMGNFMRKILLRGVISPKLSDGDQEGCLNIKVLSIDHVSKLTSAILELSGYTEGGKKKDFLSPETKA